jgi:hypothetical protein
MEIHIPFLPPSNPVIHQFWPAYNAVTYVATNPILPTPVNNPATFQNDLCSVVNVSQIESGLYFKSYPNPFLDKIRIEGLDHKNAQLRIYNMTGEIIIEKQIQDGDEIDLTYLPSAVYTLSISTATKYLTRKIVKL